MTGHEISPIPKEARPYQGERAGLVTRGIACVIDGLVVGAVLVGGYLGWAGLVFMVDPRSFEFPDTSFALSLFAGLMVSIVYLAGAWWLVGRSYGAHVMGIRVVGGKGQRLGLLRALARSAFCVFFPIGLFWCVISPRRRSVQDVVLWTAVVYDWMPRVTHAPSGDPPPAGP